MELAEGVTLDIEVLVQYSGQGKCRQVECRDGTAARYSDQLKIWATSRNWEVTTRTRPALNVEFNNVKL